MTYSLRKWAEGETTGLKLHVVDQTGRAVFSSPSYDAALAERDRLNSGGSEAVPLHQIARHAIPQPDGSIRFVPIPEEIRSYY